MLPGFIPMKREVVTLTGIAELVFAAGLLLPACYTKTGWALIAFFIIILPANVYAAIHHIDYRNGTTNGSGPGYLLFRIPLQLFFIVWVYTSTIRNTSKIKTGPGHQHIGCQVFSFGDGKSQ